MPCKEFRNLNREPKLFSKVLKDSISSGDYKTNSSAEVTLYLMGGAVILYPNPK